MVYATPLAMSPEPRLPRTASSAAGDAGEQQPPSSRIESTQEHAAELHSETLPGGVAAPSNAHALIANSDADLLERPDSSGMLTEEQRQLMALVGGGYPPPALHLAQGNSHSTLAPPGAGLPGGPIVGGMPAAPAPAQRTLAAGGKRVAVKTLDAAAVGLQGAMPLPTDLQQKWHAANGRGGRRAPDNAPRNQTSNHSGV